MRIKGGRGDWPPERHWINLQKWFIKGKVETSENSVKTAIIMCQIPETDELQDKKREILLCRTGHKLRAMARKIWK